MSKGLSSVAMTLILLNITTFFILIPIFVGVRNYSKLALETKWLLYMLILVAINQFFSIWWSNYVMINNLPFFYLYILAEMLFITQIYWLYLKTSKFKLLIPIAALLFIALFMVKFIGNWEALWIYSTYLRALEGIIVIVFAGAYFVHEYRKQEVMFLQKTAGFWISGGLILYFSCNLLLFGFSELVFEQDAPIFKSIWVIHAIVMILLYLSFTIAFLCKKKETTF
jgi:hypothetical protein